MGFTNGSKNDPPKKFVVSRKDYRTINSLMDNITDALKPTFGHVSKIYSATSRKRLTSISDFKQGHNYIVSGKDNLKLVDYPIDGYEIFKPNKLTLPKYPQNNFKHVEPKFDKLVEKSFYIFVYKNGNNFIEERQKIIIKQWMLKDMNSLLAELTAVMPLVNGAIYSYLY